MSNNVSKICSRCVLGELFQIATSEKYLVVQSIEKEKIFFSIFDLNTGKLYKEICPSKITPWFVLIGVNSTSLILQCFENRKNPESVSKWSYDWTSDELKLSNIHHHHTNIMHPSLIPENTSEFETVSQFLNKTIILGCEYLELGSNVIICYYLSENEGINRYLTILVEGQSQLNIKLDMKLKGFAPGSFFTFKNRLIFARQKNEINIYEI